MLEYVSFSVNPFLEKLEQLRRRPTHLLRIVPQTKSVFGDYVIKAYQKWRHI
jgi:hypothetical protein